jgi:uncharacterized protein (TIGR02453 family)
MAHSADFHGFSDAAYDFYLGLLADNSREYWTAHKRVYEDEVRGPMLALLEQVAPSFEADAGVRLFRPYRDVRFSKDKSPYKVHQAGFVETAPSVGYYLGLDADGLTIGGGFHARDREQTVRYRAAVDAPGSGGELTAIVAKLEKQGFEIGGAQVKTRPRGVPADHPRLDLMRREFVTASRAVAPDEARDAAFAAQLKKQWKAMEPLVRWVMDHAAPSQDFEEPSDE